MVTQKPAAALDRSTGHVLSERVQVSAVDLTTDVASALSHAPRLSPGPNQR